MQLAQLAPCRVTADDVQSHLWGHSHKPPPGNPTENQIEMSIARRLKEFLRRLARSSAAASDLAFYRRDGKILFCKVI